MMAPNRRDIQTETEHENVAANSRGIRCFRLACAAMGLAVRPLARSLVSLTRAQRDLLHDLWREAMVADATAAGEWPVTDDSLARVLAAKAAQRVADGHQTPGLRPLARGTVTREDVWAALPAEARHAVRLRTLTSTVRAGTRAHSVTSHAIEVVARHVRALLADGRAARVVDHRPTRGRPPRTASGAPKPVYAYWRVPA